MTGDAQATEAPAPLTDDEVAELNAHGRLWSYDFMASRARELWRRGYFGAP
jgi:hypothetical protein